MDGEITERSPDLLGKSSGKRKESLVKKKKKNTQQSPSGRSDGGREGKKEKGASGRICGVGGTREGPDLVGREYVYEVRVAHFRKFWSMY